jgi:protein disulfide-isomerase
MKTETSSPDTTAAPSGRACTTRTCRLLHGRRRLFLWALLIGGLLYLRWPMLKGLYYGATGAEAPASAIPWRTDFTAALAEARASGKPVLIDFTASWCPPCKVMKHQVWPDAEVAQAASAFIPVMIDVDEPGNEAVAQRYGVRGIPTILVVDADGRVLREAAFMSKGGMIDFLKKSA